MAGVPGSRSARLAFVFAIYACLACAATLGAFEALPGVLTMLLLLAVLPFLIGALVGRPWTALALFLLVALTAFLPDRTVVETSANSTTYTIYTTALAPTLMFATVVGVATLAGVAAVRPSRVARNSLLQVMVDSALGRVLVLLLAFAAGGAPLLVAAAAGLILRALQTRR